MEIYWSLEGMKEIPDQNILSTLFALIVSFLFIPYIFSQIFDIFDITTI